MNVPTDIQIIHGPDGSPAFVVIPYAQYMAQYKEADLIPHDVVSRMVDGATPIRAWREHLHLTQDEVARRLGVAPSTMRLTTSWGIRSASLYCAMYCA
ncbi:helix-turn-helix transcriptional regulator [Pseudomonas protegens]|uniref:helix-turn-helix domain-containing protein n=1 Tax=Pseudomonas protegens TaxID=380021 RepID=UPI0031F5A4A2